MDRTLKLVGLSTGALVGLGVFVFGLIGLADSVSDPRYQQDMGLAAFIIGLGNAILGTFAVVMFRSWDPEMVAVRPPAFVPQETGPAYYSFNQEVAAEPSGFDMLRGAISSIFGDLGIVGTIYVLAMALNTVVGVIAPTGRGLYVIPLAGIALIIRRAMRGRWLAVIVLAFVWVLGVMVKTAAAYLVS